MHVSLLLVATIGLALTFAFANGVHDTTALTATAVASRSMTPRAALAVATAGNLLGGLTSTAVATTVASRLIAPSAPVTLDVLVAALAGAIAWSGLTWYVSLPASASYALIGGLVGASLAAGGLGALHLRTLARLVLVPALGAPLVALALALGALVLASRLVRRTALARAFATFRLAQIGTSFLLSFAHGLGDAQKTMGVIVLALVASGRQSGGPVPAWVVVTSAATLAAGTFAGGLGRARRRGVRIHRIEPPRAFAVQSAAALAVLYASALGLPTSTGLALTGASIGTAPRGRLRSLGIAAGVEILLTVLAAGLVAALVYLPLRLR